MCSSDLRRGGAWAPRRRSRGDSGRATAPSSVRAGDLRASVPRPAPPWGAGAPGGGWGGGGAPARRAPPGPREPTSDLCLTWSYSQNPSLCAAPPNPAQEALRRALRHQGHANPAAVVESDLRRAGDERTGLTRSCCRAVGGADSATHWLRSCKGVPVCPPRTLRCRAGSGDLQGPTSTFPSQATRAGFRHHPGLRAT